jgi:DeoR/GlpR family transcriptional regulator of sugar metabolism
MLAALRRQHILDELQLNGSALISRLAEQLAVSEMTIRRDLAGLENDGLLERVHGGAVLAQRGVEEPGFDKKVLCQQEEKAAIANVAASMVKPGSAVGLSAGTTTYMLALQLAQVGGVTVLTNSMKVWNELQRGGDGRSHVILTGGDFRTPSDALVGPTADATIRSMYVDVLFLGVHGMDPVAGFTTPNISEAETNRTFIGHARRLVVLADHTKWRTIGLHILAPLSAADTIITDQGIAAQDQQLLASQVDDLRVVRSGPDGSTRARTGRHGPDKPETPLALPAHRGPPGGTSRSQPAGRVPPQVIHGGAGGARTHDRQIMSPLL